MNLLIVFAFAGDSTMTRFLAIAERPQLRGGRSKFLARASRVREGGPYQTGREGGKIATARRAISGWRLAIRPPSRIANRESRTAMLKLIALFRWSKALVLIGAALGVLRLMHPAVAQAF